MTIQEKVQKGIELLSSYFKDDWWNRIDLDELDMSHHTKCILGQLFTIPTHLETISNSNYTWGRDALFPREGGVLGHGFWTNQSSDWPLLEEEWTRQIKELRSKSP